MVHLGQDAVPARQAAGPASVPGHSGRKTDEHDARSVPRSTDLMWVSFTATGDRQPPPSQSSSTTAVWDRLWGSTPMMVAGHNHGLRRVSIENVTVAIGLLLDRRWRLVA